MKLLSHEQMAEIDRISIEEKGMASLTLMEQAGEAVYSTVLSTIQKKRFKSILIIAGSGNNGGDALVVSRLLSRKKIKHTVLLIKTTGTQEFNAQLISSESSYARRIIYKEQKSIVHESWDLVIDGLCGTGLKSPLRDLEFVENYNKNKGFKIAIDIPSGLWNYASDSDRIMKADLCLCIGEVKTALFTPLGRTCWNQLRKLSIGFPKSVLKAAPSQAKMIKKISLASPAAQSYKKTRGSVFIYGGNIGTLGAPKLSALGAQAAGAGLVTHVCDEELYSYYAAQYGSVMVKTEADLSMADGVLIGPGWGRSGEREAQCASLISEARGGVIDADGLYHLANLLKSGTFGKNPDLEAWILTPHPGELRFFYDLIGDGKKAPSQHNFEQYEFQIQLSKKLRTTIILRQHVLTVTDPDGNLSIIDGMCPQLGCAGSGDLFAGFLAGLFLREQISPGEAAIAAGFIQQKAGKKAASALGWFTPESFAPYLAKILWDEEGKTNGR
jgi:hydroxyethylthiazole kinase-like uncharacterized protein yjeF